MKAVLKNYQQSPRKVRLVADAIRGRKVEDSLAILHGLDKKVSEPMAKLIKSAVSSAETQGKSGGALVIKGIRVDEGRTLRRIRPRARGVAAPIRKRSSIISIELQ